jgi:hypothetical protein
VTTNDLLLNKLKEGKKIMATKKRIPPRPIPKPPIKPTSPRKDGKATPKPKSGGFGRAEDQVIKATSAYINTAGKGIRSVATGANKVASGVAKDAGKVASIYGRNVGKVASAYGKNVGKVASGIGKVASSVLGGGGPPAGSFASSKPAPKKPKPTVQGGKLAKVQPKREPSGAYESRSGKRKPPTKRSPERGRGVAPRLPRTM